jgi:hypothetical protein
MEIFLFSTGPRVRDRALRTGEGSLKRTPLHLGSGVHFTKRGRRNLIPST